MVIEGIEVEIRQELAGEVADRQASGSLQRSEQSVAAKDIDGGATAGTVGQDGAEQPEGAGAGNPALQLGDQREVIDGGEVEANVGLKDPAIVVAGPGKAAQGAMAAEAFSVGATGGDEVPLQRRRDHRDQGMVHDPIAKGGGAHQPGFGLTNQELPVGTGSVSEALQLVQ